MQITFSRLRCLKAKRSRAFISSQIESYVFSVSASPAYSSRSKKNSGLFKFSPTQNDTYKFTFHIRNSLKSLIKNAKDYENCWSRKRCCYSSDSYRDPTDFPVRSEILSQVVHEKSKQLLFQIIEFDQTHCLTLRSRGCDSSVWTDNSWIALGWGLFLSEMDNSFNDDGLWRLKVIGEIEAVFFLSWLFANWSRGVSKEWGLGELLREDTESVIVSCESWSWWSFSVFVFFGRGPLLVP